MKRLFYLACLVAAVNMAQARDLEPQEIRYLQKAQVLQPLEQLDVLALQQHPGARISETELEQEYGRYVYRVELRDARGVEWDLELDASTGEILKNYQDD